MVLSLIVGLQTVLSIPVDAASPVRFGVPVPAAALAEGLALRGPGVLQWRRLPIGGEAPDPVWIEVALAGTGRRATIERGGTGPTPEGGGPVYVHEREELAVEHGRRTVDRWRYRSGAEDERRRDECHLEVDLGGEHYGIGEARTLDSAALAARAVPALALPRRVWSTAGVLPPAGRLGADVRRHLVAAERRLVELPGLRGAGDFVRSDDTITNLEFDTTLALVRLALATGDAAAFARARRCARQLMDRDLDLRTGLPFPHGQDHRTGRPEPGHAWLFGLLVVGLVTADDAMVRAAQAIARGLASRPPLGQGRDERARDYAWPLLEFEALLAVDPDPVVAAAADRYAVAIDRRFDWERRTYRFGEGEVGAGIYLERGWITGGLVVPALQAHLRRRPDAAMAEHVAAAQQELLAAIGRGQAGLPTAWRCGPSGRFAMHRGERDPRVFLLLEGLPLDELRRLLRREEVRATLADVPALDDPDLPTSLSMVARCAWVYR